MPTVNTVLGPVETADLEFILSHEHLGTNAAGIRQTTLNLSVAALIVHGYDKDGPQVGKRMLDSTTGNTQPPSRGLTNARLQTGMPDSMPLGRTVSVPTPWTCPSYGVTRQFQGSIDHIARYASERDRFPDKSLSDLQTIKDQLAGDISFLQEESQGLHTNLDELLLSNQDVEFNISQHEQALAIVRPEDRPQEEQLLQELRRALDTLVNEIAALRNQQGGLTEFVT